MLPNCDLWVSAQAQQPNKDPADRNCRSNRDVDDPGPLVEHSGKGCETSVTLRGKTSVRVSLHSGKPDRVPGLVSELVQLKVDVLVLSNLPGAIRAAKQATQTIPVVMVATHDPVEDGIVESLARPGGNITGLTRLTRELSGKRLELFKETVPRISRVGILWTRGLPV